MKFARFRRSSDDALILVNPALVTQLAPATREAALTTVRFDRDNSVTVHGSPVETAALLDEALAA